jgi:hypothetical protein
MGISQTKHVAERAERRRRMTNVARVWHPWLRVQRLLRQMLGTRWDEATWKQVKPEVRNALAERSRIQRAGWFN